MIRMPVPKEFKSFKPNLLAGIGDHYIPVAEIEREKIMNIIAAWQDVNAVVTNQYIEIDLRKSIELLIKRHGAGERVVAYVLDYAIGTDHARAYIREPAIRAGGFYKRDGNSFMCTNPAAKRFIHLKAGGVVEEVYLDSFDGLVVVRGVIIDNTSGNLWKEATK